MLHHVMVVVPCDFGELIASPASVAVTESHSDRQCRNDSAFEDRWSMGLKASRRIRWYSFVFVCIHAASNCSVSRRQQVRHCV